MGDDVWGSERWAGMATKNRRTKRKNRRGRHHPPGVPVPRIGRPGLVDGLPGPHGTTLRLARSGEASDVTRLMAMAGVTPEPELASAIDDGAIGTAILDALIDGQTPILTQLARTVASPRPIAELSGLTVVLVAVRSHDVVGALLAYPPFGVIAQGIAGGIPLPEMLVTGAGMVRFKGLGVNEDTRRAGIGSALMRTGMRLWTQLDYLLIYGQIRTGQGLEAYYPRFGFTVLDAGAAIPLTRLGVPMGISPEPGEQLIVHWT
jgi:GNAT superfamily N-acetyltransferase